MLQRTMLCQRRKSTFPGVIYGIYTLRGCKKTRSRRKQNRKKKKKNSRTYNNNPYVDVHLTEFKGENIVWNLI